MLLIAYGTRPEYIKLKPLLKLLPKGKYLLLNILQHEHIIDPNKSHRTVFIPPHINRLDSIVQSILSSPRLFENITHVMVQGDTTSAFTVALAAFHRKIPIIHLEAGMRSYENEPYPEEFNRRAISLMASLHLCPTKQEIYHLLDEQILKYDDHSNYGFESDGAAYDVGNTAMDNLIELQNESSNNIFVTLHRRENHEKMDEWFSVVSSLGDTLAKDGLKIFLPLHPNPNVTKHKDLLKNVNVLEPLSHEESVEYIRKARLVITDSGGVQEEAAWFKKWCVVCRKYTERFHNLKRKGAILCFSPNKLQRIVQQQLKKPIHHKHLCPFGDGHASEKIIKILEKHGVI